MLHQVLSLCNGRVRGFTNVRVETDLSWPAGDMLFGDVYVIICFQGRSSRSEYR